MLGNRLPKGGPAEFLRLFREDAVLNVFDPIIRQAVDEFPAALAELRERFPIGDGPLGLIGGSGGAWVAQSVLTNTDVPVSAVALVSPAIRLTSVVERYERLWGVPYPWSERSRAVADRLDFVARADEIAERDVALLLVNDARDDESGFLRARRATAPSPVPTLTRAHGPGANPCDGARARRRAGSQTAPQSAEAASVDAARVDWFRCHTVFR